MKRFEYKLEYIYDELISRLDGEGSQGWEVVGINNHSYFNSDYGVQQEDFGYQVIFKREI